MNQRQANNLVRLIEYFESVPEDRVDLSSAGEETFVAEDFDFNSDFDPETKTVSVRMKECGTTFCLAGHLPYAFPSLYREKKCAEFYEGVLEIRYDMPACKGFPVNDRLDGCDAVCHSIEKNFGISAFHPTLFAMVHLGNTGGYRYLDSHKEAVLSFLRDQLGANGYEIAEEEVTE